MKKKTVQKLYKQNRCVYSYIKANVGLLICTWNFCHIYSYCYTDRQRIDVTKISLLLLIQKRAGIGLDPMFEIYEYQQNKPAVGTVQKYYIFARILFINILIKFTLVRPTSQSSWTSNGTRSQWIEYRC